MLPGPKQKTKPVCLGCLVPVTGTYCCPSCNYPMCSATCPNMDYHTENECSVFPRLDILTLVGETREGGDNGLLFTLVSKLL